MRPTQHRSTLAALAVSAALLVPALAGCSGGGATSGDSAGGSGSAGDASASRAGRSNVQAEAQAPRAAVRTRSVIKTGEIAVTAAHLDRVRDEVDRLLASFGGTIDREDTSNARDGSIDRSTLVLRVPVDDFDTAKKALSRLGRLRSSTEAEKDVTTRVIDTAERVQTLQNSLDRLQKYQRSAKDVGALIRYEDQITVRQSELQSLKAQQGYLSSQTSMSTITLYLSTPEKYVAPPGALDDAGFVAGLTGGWHALGAFVVIALTVLGAALPFLVVLVPAWLLLLRERRRRRGSSGAVTP